MMFPPKVSVQLAGWSLFFARLQVTGKGREKLKELRCEVEERCRASHKPGELATHPTVAAVRRLFRQAGCDPTRWRPSSEALVRRILRGETLPEILPVVDINNCISVELLVPACVMTEGRVGDSLTLRAGGEGETMLSLRGLIDLGGKPVLVDANGPVSTPITDAERVKVRDDTEVTWLVTYLPQGVVEASCVDAALHYCLQQAPVANVLATHFVSASL